MVIVGKTTVIIKYFFICFLQAIGPFNSNVLTRIFLLLFAVSAVASEQVALRESYAGNLSFELGGGTFRDAANECQTFNTSSDNISLPAGSSIEAAFLYWAASGQSNDNLVVFNGTTVTADEMFTETFYFNNRNNYSYGARANVTDLVSNSSSSYSVSGVTIDTQTNYCNSGLVFGGWALVVIYENPSEPLRVVNLFDGYQGFRDTFISLTPTNFVIADNPAAKGGRHAHITWEGDSGNSQTLTYSETLQFNGNTLIDSGNPSNNQFNSYSNVIGNTSGVDIDSYEIGSYISAGDTSVTTTYSSGGDYVLLSAEIISVPNQAVADMTITSSSAVSVYRGSDANYTLAITNNGPSLAPSGSAVTIPLSDGLLLSGSAGSGWSCSATTSLVTCSYAAALNDDDSSQPLSLSFDTSATTLDSIILTATVNGQIFDNRYWNNDTPLEMTIGAPDLSTSAKTGEDVNSGNLAPGDTLRFSITVVNTGTISANGVNVTDHLPSQINSYTLVSAPAGSTNNSVLAPAGDYGAGTVVIDNITIAAGETETIVIEAVISAAAVDGETVDNTAIITDAQGNNLQVQSATLTVSTTFTSGSNKPLYLQNDQTLTRVASTSTTAITLAGAVGGTSASWTLTPALQTDVSLDYSSGTIPVQLILQSEAGGGGGGTRNHNLTIRLLADGTEIARYDNNLGINRNTPTQYSLDLTVTNPLALSSGDTMSVEITQQACGGRNGTNCRDLYVYPFSSGNTSQINLTSNTVINVNSLEPYSSAYAAGAVMTKVIENSIVYLRAVVSDPFGYSDITSARMTITDPAGNPVNDSGGSPVTDRVLTAVSSSGAYNTYEQAIEIPDGASSIGNWVVTLTADEGYEGDVYSSRSKVIQVYGRPEMSITKTTLVIYDPVNGSNNPKRIPGAEILYTLTTTNAGDGTVDENTLVIVDPVTDLMPLFVSDLQSGSPIGFVDGSPPSNLTFTFEQLDSSTDDVDFSDDNGATFGYVPQPDAGGYDAAVTHIRLTPKGVMSESNGSSNPAFSFQYQVLVE